MPMMEKKENLTDLEGANQDEQGLSEELESLYRRVARLDQSDNPTEKGSDTDEGNKEFRERPWRTAPYQDPQNQEELMKKLMAIRDAYERLLTYWPFAQENPPDPL